MCCSHCCPTNPRSAFDLLIEYCPREVSGSRAPSAEAGGRAHDGAHGEGEDLVEADEAVEEGDLGGLAGRLLEGGARVGGDPVLVIALGRQIRVEAAGRSANPEVPDMTKTDD